MAQRSSLLVNELLIDDVTADSGYSLQLGLLNVAEVIGFACVVGAHRHPWRAPSFCGSSQWLDWLDLALFGSCWCIPCCTRDRDFHGAWLQICPSEWVSEASWGFGFPPTRGEGYYWHRLSRPDHPVWLVCIISDKHFQFFVHISKIILPGWNYLNTKLSGFQVSKKRFLWNFENLLET